MIVDPDGHYAIFQGSSASATKHEMLSHTYLLNGLDFEHSLDYNDEMEEDGDVDNKAEDLEVRMDLTDDLLHMVCIFVFVPFFLSSLFL